MAAGAWVLALSFSWSSPCLLVFVDPALQAPKINILKCIANNWVFDAFHRLVIDVAT